MLWIDKVFSLACQATKITASTTAKNVVDATYGTFNSKCRPSAAMVPNTLTMATANQ